MFEPVNCVSALDRGHVNAREPGCATRADRGTASAVNATFLRMSANREGGEDRGEHRRTATQRARDSRRGQALRRDAQVPPAASMRSRAALKACACTVSGLQISPLAGSSPGSLAGAEALGAQRSSVTSSPASNRASSSSRLTAGCGCGTARTASTSSCAGRAACASACGSASGRPRSERGPWRPSASRRPSGHDRRSCPCPSLRRVRRACVGGGCREPAQANAGRSSSSRRRSAAVARAAGT